MYDRLQLIRRILLNGFGQISRCFINNHIGLRKGFLPYHSMSEFSRLFYLEKQSTLLKSLSCTSHDAFLLISTYPHAVLASADKCRSSISKRFQLWRLFSSGVWLFISCRGNNKEHEYLRCTTSVRALSSSYSFLKTFFASRSRI